MNLPQHRSDTEAEGQQGTMTVTTVSQAIQIIALSACLAVHVAPASEHMSGLRRALQTMAGSSQVVSIPVERPLAARFG